MAEVKRCVGAGVGGEGPACEGRRHRQLTEQVSRMTAVRFPQTVIYRQLNITRVDFFFLILVGRECIFAVMLRQTQIPEGLRARFIIFAPKLRIYIYN